jgi:nitroreductase
MDVENAVRHVRVIRHFSAEPLRVNDLTAILDAGRHAGSSKNLQRWHFIVVEDRERLRLLTKVGRFAGHLAGAATAIAIVTPDPNAPDAPLSITWDSGRAAQNMVLVAWARGVGSAPATVYNHKLCRRLLGYPADQRCEFILSLGYPAEDRLMARAPRSGGRRPLNEIVFRERWGQTEA